MLSYYNEQKGYHYIDVPANVLITVTNGKLLDATTDAQEKAGLGVNEYAADISFGRKRVFFQETQGIPTFRFTLPDGRKFEMKSERVGKEIKISFPKKVEVKDVKEEEKQEQYRKDFEEAYNVALEHLDLASLVHALRRSHQLDRSGADMTDVSGRTEDNGVAMKPRSDQRLRNLDCGVR